MEILFVFGFLVMLMLTGISLLGIIVALVVTTIVMIGGGLLMVVIKMFPWLLLAVVGIGAYRAYQWAKLNNERWLSR